MSLFNFFNKILVSSILMLFGYSQTVSAQTADSSHTSKFSPSITVSGSYAPVSFRAWGKMLNTNHMFFKLGYNYTEFDLFSFRTQLGAELIVTGLINYPEDGRNGDRQSIYGFGMVPLIANIPLSKKNNFPFITSSLGFIVTERHFPNMNGARFNFLLDTGLGYQFQTGENYSVQVGYKLHHLSNGYRAIENPGIDSVMFFFKFLIHI